MERYRLLRQLLDHGDIDAIGVRDTVLGFAHLEPGMHLLLLLVRQLARLARPFWQSRSQAALCQGLRCEQGTQRHFVGLERAVLDPPLAGAIYRVLGRNVLCDDPEQSSRVNWNEPPGIVYPHRLAALIEEVSIRSGDCIGQ